MQMQDVMRRLRDIVEAGYDNEDMQRGITAAATQNYEVSEDAVKEGASKSKMIDDAESMSMGEFVEEYSAQGMSDEEAKQAYKEIMGEAVSEGFKSLKEGASKSKMIDDAESMSMGEFVEEYSAEGMSEAEAKQAYKEIMGEAIGEEAVSDDGVEEVHEVDGQSGVLGLVSESVEADEAVVSIPVNELAELMQLAGYTDYAEKIEEYANEPDETYMDAEEQLVGLSGGLNSPKSMHPTAAGGDNAMAVRALDVEEIGETFYQQYNAMIDDLKTEEL
jgi:hypothetical protein